VDLKTKEREKEREGGGDEWRAIVEKKIAEALDGQ
jgi:hypothetical protein